MNLEGQLNRAANGVLIGFVLFWAALGGAQPVFRTFYSLEARVAQAQCIFVGSVSNCSGTVTERSGFANGVMNCRITVQVDKAIKGQCGKTVELMSEVSPDDKRFGQWAEHHTSFLFFIEDKTWSNFGGHNPRWSTIRLGEAVPAEKTYSADNPVYLMDFSVVTNSQEVLARTRQFAKRRLKAPLQFFTFGPRPELPLWTSLMVPVQPSLEKFAHERIKSTNWMERAEAARALQYFKSASNTKLLKPLLNDPSFQDWQTEHVVWKTTRSYYVRQAAYDVLSGWDAVVDKPLTEEALPWRFDPAVRFPLPVQVPTRLWVHRATNSLEMGTDYTPGMLDTNIMTGSNMVVGTRFEWFVYPEGEIRHANASRLDLEYSTTPISRVEYFEIGRDGMPVEGRKYNVEMEFTIFETDNPPAGVDNTPLNPWRPQDGKNYRVLFQHRLRQATE